MADLIEMEDTSILPLFNDFSENSEFEGFDLDQLIIVANVHAVFAINLF